jgi:hypothetical protein
VPLRVIDLNTPIYQPTSRCATMSQSPSSSTSSSNIRTIFVAAMKEYEKKTKTDLLTHPLATQLQSCASSTDILAVLHEQVNEFDKARSHNEKLSSWLNPTINVLYAFSASLGQGVGLVSLNSSTGHFLIVFTDILARKYYICWYRSSLHGKNIFVEGSSIPMSVRPPRMSTRVKKPLPISLSVSRTSSDGLTPIRKYHQLTQ